MTETEWIECRDAGRLLSHLHGRRSRVGKSAADTERFRLFGLACCRRIWAFLADGDRRAVECLEEYARTGRREVLLQARRLHRPAGNAASRAASTADYRTKMVAAARNYATSVVWTATNSSPTKAAMGYIEAARVMAFGEAAERHVLGQPEPVVDWHIISADELAAQCDLLRDIFGNPFRPVAFDPAWRTGTAVEVARGMYESREFAAMPILADALQDAGCDNDDVLAHCRGPGPHVRGCWVVDLVLGKG